MNAFVDPVKWAVVEEYTELVAEAFTRIAYDIECLHARQNDWELDPSDGMYVFKGFVSPFIVKKHTVDLLREVWHINDGARELLNAKWSADSFNPTKFDLDKGNGPGKAIVKEFVKDHPDIQLCADLANLTKHYRLTRATRAGNGPPQIGDSFLQISSSGKFDLEKHPDGSRIIKVERPAPMRPTFVVLDENDNQIGDAVDIAIKARDAWLELFDKYLVKFAPEKAAS